MPDIRSVSFNHDGWFEVDSQSEDLLWLDSMEEPTAVLSLHFFAVPPNIPVALTDLAELRRDYRFGVNKMGVGMVSADVVLVDGLPSIRTILKIPRQPHGMDYMGTLIMPFEDCSYVVKIQAREVGFTGLRDSIVASEFDLSLEEMQSSWARDPYDPTGDYPWMPNKSEDEKYDAQFPEHPLTRVRAVLNAVQESFKFGPEVGELEPFTGK